MTDQELIALKQKRAKALADARAIHERAVKDGNRTLTADEQKQYDAFMAERNSIDAIIQREENIRKLATDDARINQSDLSSDPENPGNEERGADEENRGDGKDVQKRQVAVFAKYLRGGIRSLTEAEARDLSVGSGPDGGFTVAPMQWVANLIKFVDDMTFIRAKATKHTLTQGESLGMPSLDTDISDADWTSELGTGSLDTSIKFGRRELKPSPLAKRVKISNLLLRRSSLPIESLVLQRLGYKLGVSEEKAFLTGNGVNRPLGLFTASNDGIPTSRDVSSGGTSLAATDGTTSKAAGTALINMKFSLKAAYWGRAEWLFHRDIMSVIAKLTDANGQYLFRESLRVGEQDTLLGRPINMSEFAPNTNTTGLYIGMLADFSYYHIVDALNVQVQRLNELYAETNQTGFIARMEVDGQPVLSEAFARLKND